MKKILFVLPIVALLAAGCNQVGQTTVQTPVVKQSTTTPTTTPVMKSVSPTSGPADTTTVTVSGTGFTTSSNSVYLSATPYFDSSNNFGLLVAKVGSSDTRTLKFIIPSSIPNNGGNSLINPGTYTLTVVNANGISDHATFTVTPSMATSCVVNSFTASPLKVQAGGTATLSWSSNNCMNIVIEGTGLSSLRKGVDSSGNMTVSPTAYPESSTTYTIEAHDKTGTGVVTKSVTVEVNQ